MTIKELRRHGFNFSPTLSHYVDEKLRKGGFALNLVPKLYTMVNDGGDWLVNVIVRINEPFEAIELELIIVNPAEARKGHGTEALKQLESVADDLGMEIRGIASVAGDSTMTQEQLETWYEKNGFSVDGRSRIRYIPKSTT